MAERIRWKDEVVDRLIDLVEENYRFLTEALSSVQFLFSQYSSNTVKSYKNIHKYTMQNKNKDTSDKKSYEVSVAKKYTEDYLQYFKAIYICTVVQSDSC